MDDATFFRLLRDVRKLKPRQVAAMDRALAETREKAGAVLALETEDGGENAAPPACPRCGVSASERWGFARTGFQRQVCGVRENLHRPHRHRAGRYAPAWGRGAAAGDDDRQLRGG